MKIIGLNNDLELALEPLGNRLRLIIVKDDKELACRKEYVKNLQRFLMGDEEKLFKGRLQLFKFKDEVEIILNKMPIGKISLSNLKVYLEDSGQL